MLESAESEPPQPAANDNRFAVNADSVSTFACSCGAGVALLWNNSDSSSKTTKAADLELV